MVSIELTNGQKFQVGVVVLILGMAGYFLWTGMKAPPDNEVATWVTQSRTAMDPRRPISATNPADPTKNLVLSIFACHDGKLQVTDYPAVSGMKSYFDFAPDLRRKSFEIYKDPWEHIFNISDPYKKTLTYAAYAAAENRPAGLLGRANLDADQRKAERDARQEMMDGVTLIDEGCKRGTFKGDIYSKIMTALKEYKDLPGDPQKNAKKAAAAKKFVELALQYIQLMDQEKAKYVEKYIATMDAMLKQDQKDKLGQAVNLAVRSKIQRLRAG